MRLAGERETLGLYLTGHPIAEYERELQADHAAGASPMSAARGRSAPSEGGVARSVAQP